MSKVTKVSQVVPGFWTVSADTGTVSALGVIRATDAGFAWVGQGTAGGGRAVCELEQRANIRPNDWKRDGFASVDAVVAYLNEKLAA